METRNQATDLSAIPSFCTHEHWGSIAALGGHSAGFAADFDWGVLPKRAVGIADLVLDPYLGGLIAGAGLDPHGIAREHGHVDCYAFERDDPSGLWQVIEPVLRALRTTGMVQSVRRGVQQLYGVDLLAANDVAWGDVSQRLAANYRRIFGWYQDVMAAARFSHLIRPMWAEIYLRENARAEAAEERSFTNSLMRVDVFLDMWREDFSPRRELVALTGIEPVEAASWRAFLDKIFDAADRGGCLGTKQLQAYTRPIDYAPVADTEVKWSGERTPAEVRQWQDWVMHECFARTAARGWPHQCHVGTHNLPHSHPAPLGAIAARYPQMKLVLLHAWPYIEDAGWLAHHYPNVYLDSCWQVLLNPAYFRQALITWLGYVPHHKITVGHDATSAEMAVGACSLVREILGDVLAERAALLGLTPHDIPKVAADILHNNAVKLYGIGTAWSA